MPKQRKHQIIRCQYFAWLIGPRTKGGVFYADGRSNKINLGRHSLGTKSEQDALGLLRELDMSMALKNGLAASSLLDKAQNLLTLAEGIELYLNHVKRPSVMKGASAKTIQRYKAVFDKFQAYSATQSVKYWQEVSKRTLEGYGRWLSSESYAYATQYLELTTLKQAIKWFVSEKHLAESCIVKLPLAAPEGTMTYCYSDVEVQAMIEHCLGRHDLMWLGHIVVGLVYTGLRIDELAQLRWPAINLEKRVLQVIDNTRTGLRRNNRLEMSTKTHASRILPIYADLLGILQTLARHPDDRVFHGPVGRVVKPDVVRNVLIREVLKPLAARFPGDPASPNFIDGRLHSCRHFFCSKCARDGVPEQTVMLWLGHRDSKMVRHYYHLNDDEAQRQMSKLKSVGGTGAV
jgi:integrase